MQKLDKLGIQNKNLTWLRNYLTNRLANGILSPKNTITCGVPQGSVLGPLLFLVYVNDVSNVLNDSGHYLYTYDTVIFKSGTNLQNTISLLQSDLDNFGSWCSSNKLTINTKKSNYVIYGTNQRVSRIRDCILSIQNDILVRTRSYKYLGVHIDSHMNFNTHIDNCCKIVSHKLYLLSKVRHCITEDACVKLYKTMIAPLIDYGDTIYTGTSDNKLYNLQKLQNRRLRICLNRQEHVSRMQLHQTCNITP